MSEALDPELAGWVGRSAMAHDIVTPAMVDALHATLDHDRPPAREGDPAPQGIHWLCATPKVRARDIGADGHPHLGLLLPPVKLPRRMWAGSVIDFHRPIRAGERIERRSTIASITPKTGSAGPLVFVEVDHAVYAERRTGAERAPHDRLPWSAGYQPARQGGIEGRLRRSAGGFLLHATARSGHAVSLFGADLQRPSDPLRPSLCHPGRGLSGARRPWPADRHPAARSRGKPAWRQCAEAVLLSRRGAGLWR